MRYVTERRLTAARRRLDAPRAGDDVTRVAVACGFCHLGRFAGAYLRAFGERPSDTLDAARRR
jgi:transcriptional regulator GlxA family with amidase domain